ncbi:hypothetical protein [Sediminibacter sp. Hel_I_10]|uniref:hypothetical protein n=1 Tax=Sediminibacter sp. Hel_I_10 TaxID=1392490 RepID=UPI00047AE592|nr:hypothetical protein [Sediminibacter sp. Hel_I_10]
MSILTDKEKTKEAVEKHLLEAMNQLDLAGAKMLSLKSQVHELNFDKLMQAKAIIKKPLQRNYDAIARRRRK